MTEQISITSAAESKREGISGQTPDLSKDQLPTRHKPDARSAYVRNMAMIFMLASAALPEARAEDLDASSDNLLADKPGGRPALLDSQLSEGTEDLRPLHDERSDLTDFLYAWFYYCDYWVWRQYAFENPPVTLAPFVWADPTFTDTSISAVAFVDWTDGQYIDQQMIDEFRAIYGVVVYEMPWDVNLDNIEAWISEEIMPLYTDRECDNSAVTPRDNDAGLSPVPRNYPNPFNSETRIDFHMPTDGEYSLAIYNINGELQRRVPVSGAAGESSLVIDADDMPSAFYLYRLETSSGQAASATGRMLLAK